MFTHLQRPYAPCPTANIYHLIVNLLKAHGATAELSTLWSISFLPRSDVATIPVRCYRPLR